MGQCRDFIESGWSRRYLADAGAAYLWADEEAAGNVPLDFEVVFDRAAYAEFWLNPGIWKTQGEAMAEDERYTGFAAMQNNMMFNNNARLNEHGGNDYWESGVISPHLVLADLIRLFHPTYLSDHELYYYRRVPPRAEE